MNLSDKIHSAYQQAFKAREKETTAALRLILAAIKNQSIELKRTLTDDETISVLRHEAKKRRESILAYRQAGREELAKQEEFEQQLIDGFLPQQMSEAQIQAVVDRLKSGSNWPDNFGEAMKLVMAELKGQADGKLTAKVVNQSL